MRKEKNPLFNCIYKAVRPKSFTTFGAHSKELFLFYCHFEGFYFISVLLVWATIYCGRRLVSL